PRPEDRRGVARTPPRAGGRRPRACGPWPPPPPPSRTTPRARTTGAGRRRSCRPPPARNEASGPAHVLRVLLAERRGLEHPLLLGRGAGELDQAPGEEGQGAGVRRERQGGEQGQEERRVEGVADPAIGPARHQVLGSVVPLVPQVERPLVRAQRERDQ